MINEPWFYERVSDDVCPVCRGHKYIIAERMPGGYCMHTMLVFPQATVYFHKWHGVSDRPACLGGFKPVKAVDVISVTEKEPE